MDRDFYSFARLCDVKLPLTVRMCVGARESKARVARRIPRMALALTLTDDITLNAPTPCRASLQGRTLPARDVFVTAQLFADNKPLTLPYQTACKSFRNTASRSAADDAASLGIPPPPPAISSAAAAAAAVAAAADGSGAASTSSTTLSRDFGELLVFPIRLADLPLSAQLVFTAWDASSIEEVQHAYLESPSKLSIDASVSKRTTRQEKPFARVLGGTTIKLFGKKGCVGDERTRCKGAL